MTDRIRTLIVVLDEPIRDDDAEPVVDAIRMLRGVASVEPVVYDGYLEAAAHKRAAIQDAVTLLRVAADKLIEESYRT